MSGWALLGIYLFVAVVAAVAVGFFCRDDRDEYNAEDAGE